MNMPPSPPVTETRPEYFGQVLTSTQALSNAERLRLWMAKVCIIEFESWKKRTSEAKT